MLSRRYPISSIDRVDGSHYVSIDRYFDQLYVLCWCDYCKENFRTQYGVDMPSEPQNPAVVEFRDGTCIEYCRRIRKVIDETRPNTVYLQNSVFLMYATLEEASKYIDALLPESHFGGGKTG